MAVKKYVVDQQGIFKRYLQEKDNWDIHLNNCKRFIKNAITKTSCRTVAILGSGWWLDIPYEFLAERCEKVYLCDITHPKPIVSKANQYDNFILIEADLTGNLVEDVGDKKIKRAEVIIERLRRMQNIGNYLFNDIPQVIFSLNILNQLDILFIDYLKKFISLTDNDIVQIRKLIQRNHIELLKDYNSYLISDINELALDKNQKIIEERDLLFAELVNFKQEEEWLWKFDTRGSYRNNRATHFKVIAGQFIK